LESVRCFVAVELAPRTRAELGRLEGELKRAVTCPAKWVAPEGIHLTLCFLGEISQDLVGPVKAAVAATSAQHAPLGLELAGLGAFPNLQRPQVVWVGLAGQTAQLSRLQKALEDSLVPLGYQPETRPFSPHLTLARLRPGMLPAECQSLAAVIARPSSLPHAKISVNEVSLMQSRLTPAGAVYTRLGAARLGAGQP
jgi:RNA 2',3'-cyclic 3'-phosphodiesterase